MLRVGDVPAAFQAKPHDASDDEDSGDQKLLASVAGCLGGATPPDTTAANKVAQHSPDFTMGDDSITSEALPATDLAGEKRFYDLLISSPKTTSCFASAFRVAFAKQFPTGKLGTVDTKFSGRRSGQPSTVYANIDGVVEITVDGQTQQVHDSTAQMFGNGFEADVDATGLGKAVSADAFDAAVEAVAKRVAAA